VLSADVADVLDHLESGLRNKPAKYDVSGAMLAARERFSGERAVMERDHREPAGFQHAMHFAHVGARIVRIKMREQRRCIDQVDVAVVRGKSRRFARQRSVRVVARGPNVEVVKPETVAMDLAEESVAPVDVWREHVEAGEARDMRIVDEHSRRASASAADVNDVAAGLDVTRQQLRPRVGDEEEVVDARRTDMQHHPVVRQRQHVLPAPAVAQVPPSCVVRSRHRQVARRRRARKVFVEPFDQHAPAAGSRERLDHRRGEAVLFHDAAKARKVTHLQSPGSSTPPT